MQILINFFRLSFDDKFLFLEVYVLLGMARMAVLILPFRWVASVFGERSKHNSDDVENEIIPTPSVRRVANAIRKVSPYTPWNSNCLAKAITGQIMLRRRRISTVLYFGLLKDADGEYRAHAWLKSKGAILIGGTKLDRYSIVAKFIN